MSMKKKTVKYRAKQELEDILSFKWKARGLAEAYLNDTFFKIVPFIRIGLPSQDVTERLFAGAKLYR